MPIAWVMGLLVLAYLPILARMANQWSTDEDMGHGFFVPAVAAYIAWQRKEELASLQLQPNWLGLALMLGGFAQMAVGILGAELFLQRSSFLVTTVGAVLLLGGMPLIRGLLLPLFLLLFMVPLPAIILNQITFPLQLFASGVAETVLTILGIPVLRDGNVLELASQKLSVVEACSGIRSLMSLTFLSLVYGYFFDTRHWMRVALFAGSIPIAIAANAFRVSMTGVISEFNPELAKGFFHLLEGWLIFVFALALLLGLHAALKVAARRLPGGA
jgi:exosortase